MWISFLLSIIALGSIATMVDNALNLNKAFMYLTTLIVGLFGYSASRRLFLLILGRQFADSAVLVSLTYFMLELLRDDALEYSENRRWLQFQCKHLAQTIFLLSSQYASGTAENQAWITSHFKNIERYVLEHERLIIAPKPDSLNVLRQDFYQLLRIFYSGNYGDFSYAYQQSAVEPTRMKRFVGGALNILGLIIPSALLYLLYTDTLRISEMGVDINTITIIALAWLMLTIDVALNLGIVERITGLAKTIRDLR